MVVLRNEKNYRLVPMFQLVRLIPGRLMLLIDNVFYGFVWSGIADAAHISTFEEFFFLGTRSPILSIQIAVSNEAFLQSIDSRMNREILSSKRYTYPFEGLTPTSNYVWGMAEPCVRKYDCQNAYFRVVQKRFCCREMLRMACPAVGS